MSYPKISKQWGFVILWSIFIVLLTSIPYMYGFATAPGDRVFMGDARSALDFNTYITWMKQAEDGRLLFENKYTTEPQRPAFFHPLFLMLGNISRITGAHLIVVHETARIIFGFLCLIMVYVFISYFVRNDLQRVLTFILASVGGSLGWLGYVFPSIGGANEFWLLIAWPDINVFFSVYALPLFSSSIALLLLCFYLFLRAIDLDKVSYAASSGFCGLILLFNHPYDTLIVFPVIFLYMSARFFIESDKAFLKKASKMASITLGLSAVPVIYSLLVIHSQEAFRLAVLGDASTLSPAFIWFVLGFGLAFFAALPGIALVLSNYEEERKKLFLVVWAVSIPFLLYSPVSFQRRIVEGVYVPLAILAVMGIMWLAGKLKWNRAAAVAVFIVLCSISNFPSLGKDIVYMAKSKTGLAPFPSKEIISAFEWLEKNTKRDEIVLGHFETGNYVPAWSGNRVFIGHSPQTLFFWNKWEAVKAFYSSETGENDRASILAAAQARYVFWAENERSTGGYDPRQSSYLKKVYQKGDTFIFKVLL